MKKEIIIPVELEPAFLKNKKAKELFDKMPPSHQREYINYITEAKKYETRIKRVQKTIDTLLKMV